ncbi:MAG: class I SAM-dependent methyltransferase family protein [Candidatus Thermoplasmatota archaeon]
MKKTPFKEIKSQLFDILPKEKTKYLSTKWEKIGEVLILKIPEEIEEWEKQIAEVYANVLDCKTVLKNEEGIKGEYRQPQFKKIFGDKNTTTIHKENGIRYKIDPSKIMFSSGNMDERIHMGKVVERDETIVDLFAGIGYFTLPMAVHGEPSKIYACEKNPTAFNFLCQNIVLNNVSDIVEPLKGDNRETAPEDVADRVLLGYFGDTAEFFPTAIKCLKEQRGVLHYHDTFPDEDIPEKTCLTIKEKVNSLHGEAEITEYRRIKSYAPGISHYVFDIRVE